MSKEELEEYMRLLGSVHESIQKEHPAVSILYGDFNARSPLFWEGDSENNAGSLLNNFLISNHFE